MYLTDRLNKQQSKFLKMVNAHKIKFETMSEKDKETCLFLNSLEYVHINTVGKSISGNGVFQLYKENVDAEITEKGRMYLANEHLDKFKISVPDLVGWVLSGISLIISVIALLKP